MITRIKNFVLRRQFDCLIQSILKGLISHQWHWIYYTCRNGSTFLHCKRRIYLISSVDNDHLSRHSVQKFQKTFGSRAGFFYYWEPSPFSKETYFYLLAWNSFLFKTPSQYIQIAWIKTIHSIDLIDYCLLGRNMFEYDCHSFF